VRSVLLLLLLLLLLLTVLLRSCPDALKCLTPVNPGHLCSKDKPCKKEQICCPVTNLCVVAGAACVPPLQKPKWA